MVTLPRPEPTVVRYDPDVLADLTNAAAAAGVTTNAWILAACHYAIHGDAEATLERYGVLFPSTRPDRRTWLDPERIVANLRVMAATPFPLDQE